MSSTLELVEETSKKRKHEGNGKEKENKKKKRKQVDESLQVNGVDEDLLKADKKEKRRKKREAQSSDNVASIDNAATTLNGSEASAGISHMESKKKKRQEAEEPHPEAQMEEEQLIGIAEEDETMPDAPPVEGQGADSDEGVATTDETFEATNTEQLQSNAPSSFHSIRMSLYVPIPAIVSASVVSAICTLHLSPLLLTYFPPAEGVVLSYHNPVMSARPESQVSRPLAPPIDGDVAASTSSETLSKIGEDFGASWVWLTVTLLVFKPQPGDELWGWSNAMSEGFVGLVSYNYFQTSISKSRIPRSWLWDGPSRQRGKQRKTPKKGKLNDSDEPSQETVNDSQETLVSRDDDAIDGIAGSFVDEDGTKVSETLCFRVVDLEMIPAQEKGQRYALQLEGTLLDEQGERAVREEEREKWENKTNKSRARSRTPGTPMMSGGLPTHSRAGSIASTP